MRGYTENINNKINNIVYFAERKEVELFREEEEKSLQYRKNSCAKEAHRSKEEGKLRKKKSKVKSTHKNNYKKDKKNYKKDNKKNNIKTLIFIVKIIAVIMFVALLSLYASKINVLGQSDEEVINQYYRELEDDLKKLVHEELEEAGLKNAGITISCIIEPGISREYSVKINHGKLKECSSKELDVLKESLEGIAFPDGSCSVTYEILL